MKLKIKIETIEKVKKFCNIAASKPYHIDVLSGRYTVDAKSIMGLLSLNLSNPVIVYTSDNHKDLKSSLEDFLVK